MASFMQRIKRFILGNRLSRVIRATFDAAQETRHNRKHWSRSDELSADGASDKATRKILRKRARYECANNSYARGIVNTLANDTVGTGPRLQMMMEDSALASQIEGDFYQWCRDINFFEKLRTVRVAKAQDGEAFIKLATNPNSMASVKLDLQLIEADCITSDDASLSNIDGVVLDSFGNPSSYIVLRVHPGDGSSGGETDTIPASNMIHCYRMDRPGQHRGIPEIVPALELFAQLRRYTLATLTAAEHIADVTGVLYTDLPGTEAAGNEDPFGSIEMDRGHMISLPDGWKFGQAKAEQPTTTYAEFKHEILNEIARCLNMPYNVAAGNSSGYNYASGRMDWQTYYKSIRVDQSDMEARILDRVFALWIVEYAMVSGLGNIEGLDLSHQWFWDGMEHVDPAKEATAQAQRLANNTTTLAIECAKNGRDWEEVLIQRGREIEVMKRLGLTMATVEQTENTNDMQDEEEGNPDDQTN